MRPPDPATGTPSDVLTVLGVAPASCHSPVRRPTVIARSGVVKKLTESADLPLVVVAAPAGFGKTTTLQLWSEVDDRRFVWVHLGLLDNDPVHLVRHIAAAVHLVEPLDSEVVRVLTGAGRVMETDLLPSLGYTIGAREPMVLVLDDAHLLTSDGAARVVQVLSDYLPSGTQLVVSCRRRPDFRLARGELDHAVSELDAEDLVMTAGEAASLFAAAGFDLNADQVDAFFEQTEGWPAGLGLAALALRTSPSRTGAPLLGGGNRRVVDYLLEEVLAGLDEPIRSFLVRSSVLDRMCARLLDDLLETDDSAGLLSRIEALGNPFLVRLDDRGEWFRYHHLFREALRVALQRERPDEVNPLRSRASGVLEASGDADGAIRLAVVAGERERAADIVLRHTLQLIDEGRTALVDQWLQLLGPDLVDRYPSAAIAEAWSGISTGDPTRIARSIKAAESISHEGPLPDGSPSLPVAVAAARSIVAAEGTEGVLRDTAIIRSGGGPRTNPWWGYATCLEGTVATLVGDNDAARNLLTAGLPEVAFSPSFEAGFRGILALAEFYESDLIAAERHARRARRLCDDHNLEAVPLVISAYASAALVAARRKRADESRRDSQAARRLLARLGDMSPRTALRGYLALAQTSLELGDHDEARGFAMEATRARRRDPSCTYLNDQLDQVERQLGDLKGAGLDVTPISAAQLRVLAYLPTHLSLREIADASYISRNTVKSHVVAIYRKLGVSSRAEAVVEARRLGLLNIPGPQD